MGIEPNSIHPSTKLFDPETGVLLFKYISTVNEGKLFGEMGLEDSAPRSATVICLEDCDFAYLTKVDYDSCLKEIMRSDNERRRIFFSRQVFKNLCSANIVSRVTYDFYKSKFILQKRDYLQKQGTLDPFIYVLRWGEVLVEKIVRTEHVPDQPLKKSEASYKKYVIGFLQEGELFGEHLFMDSQALCEYSIKVVSDSATFLKMSIEDFNAHLFVSYDLHRFCSELVKQRTERREHLLKQMKDRHEEIVPHRAGEKKPQDNLFEPPKKKNTKRIQKISAYNEKYEAPIQRFLSTHAPDRAFRLVQLNDLETCVSKEILGLSLEEQNLAKKGGEKMAQKKPSLQEREEAILKANTEAFQVINKQYDLRHNMKYEAVKKFNQFVKGFVTRQIKKKNKEKGKFERNTKSFELDETDKGLLGGSRDSFERPGCFSFCSQSLNQTAEDFSKLSEVNANHCSYRKPKYSKNPFRRAFEERLEKSRIKGIELQKNPTFRLTKHSKSSFDLQDSLNTSREESVNKILLKKKAKNLPELFITSLTNSEDPFTNPLPNRPPKKPLQSPPLSQRETKVSILEGGLGGEIIEPPSKYLFKTDGKEASHLAEEIETSSSHLKDLKCGNDELESSPLPAGLDYIPKFYKPIPKKRMTLTKRGLESLFPQIKNHKDN